MLLAFEIVLFGGLAYMFYNILRNLDAMQETLRREHAEVLAALAKVERRMATLQQLEASLAVSPLIRAGDSHLAESGAEPSAAPLEQPAPQEQQAPSAQASEPSPARPVQPAPQPVQVMPQQTEGFPTLPFTPPLRPSSGLYPDPSRTGAQPHMEQEPPDRLPELKL